MNKELKGLGGIEEFREIADVLAGNEVFLNTLLRGEYTSLTELANFLIPGGLLDRWTTLSPRQRAAFFGWALRRNLRVAGITLSAPHKVKITLAAPILQRLLAVEIIRTFSRSRNQGPMRAVEELWGATKFRADLGVDHHFD